MKALYNYGISQEDARIECQAMNLRDGDNLLCIASAGEVPLNLLTMKDLHITAVDTERNQIFLSKLKLIAAIKLDTEKAARFLGYMPMNTGERKKIFKSLQSDLRPEDYAFWNEHMKEIEMGIVHGGRFEKYIAKFRPVAQLFFGNNKLRELLSCKDIEEQKDYFDQKLSSPLVKGLFKVIFHPAIYKNRGIQQQGLTNQGSIKMATFFYQRLRDFCTSTPCSLNHYFQFTFFGKVLFNEALPEYLQPSGRKAIRDRSSQLDFRTSTFSEALNESLSPRFNAFHLSNIGDWMSKDDFQEMLGLIHKKADSKSRIFYRYIHFEHPINRDLEPYFEKDQDMSVKLIKQDRFPFYSLVPLEYHRVRNIKEKTVKIY
jgi:S-adenosylmethionine:diacylglycerol 3-amino-3-carboxypropyl transferase